MPRHVPAPSAVLRPLVRVLVLPLGVLLALPLALVGCAGTGTGEPEPDPEPEVTPPAYDTDATPVCSDSPVVWTPGTPAFREVTEAWGLDAAGAEGTRLAASDLDGDGWADLFVRRGGTRSDDPAAEVRHTWLLRWGGAGFVDVTLASGLLTPRGDLGTGLRPAEVVAFADVDNDGDLDIYTGISTADEAASLGETSELMLNQGDGTFALGPAGSELRRADAIDAVAGATFVDYDRDGLVDLFVGEHNYDVGGVTEFQSDRLFKNLGTAAFTDVTEEAGLLTADWLDIDDLNNARAHSRAWGSAACDLNGDGWQDLLVPSYGRAPNHLWRGGEYGRLGETYTGYLNESVASGYAYDDDMTWEDNQFALCWCQQNPGAAGCAGLPSPGVSCTTPNWNPTFDKEPFRMGGNSGTTVCADLDNDQDMDLLTTEIKHWWAGSGADGSEVLVNDSVGEDIRFTRPGDAALGLALEHPAANWDEGHMTAAIFDFDLDGWQDIYLGASDYDGNRGHLYHQTAPLSFEEVPVQDGIDHWRSHGVAVADFDRDGDLDVVVGHSRARCGTSGECYETARVRAFENVVGDTGNWIALRLEGGEGTNRAAIGARVTLTAGGITQTREVGGGHGHYGIQHDLVVHFGLGTACDAEVTVRWPDAAGTEETWRLPAGHRFHVVQGEAQALVDDPG